MNNLKEIINNYFDNELNKSEEIMLFTQLSQNEKAREYFKEMNLLRTIVDETETEFPDNLDARIFNSIKTKQEAPIKSYTASKILSYISYLFAIILLALSLFFYSESKKYQDKLEITEFKIQKQTEMIQVLFNTLPQAEVKGEIDNAIIVTPKM